MYDTQEIANRIKQRTKFCGYHIGTMLSDLEMGVNIISHLAKGQNISSINLAKIADYLDCSVDYLLGRTNCPYIFQYDENGIPMRKGRNEPEEPNENR